MDKVKHSVAIVVRRPRDGTFLLVRRPDDPSDPLAGAWGFPAVTLAEGEDEESAVTRAGRVKLGVEVGAVRKIGMKHGIQNGTSLLLAEYEAVILAGSPAVPQPDASMTQYAALRWAADPGELAPAAGRGSLCAQVFLEAAARG